MAHHRATRAEIDLRAFRHNLQNLRNYLAPQTQIMAVVKADAYGHGAVPCARIAVASGADYLGAGVIEEGIELRKSGINTPILILGSIFANEVEDLVYYDLATILCNLPLAQALSKEGRKQNKIVSVHIKLDTGMNRLGVSPKYSTTLLDQIHNLPNLKVEGISTHFSSADNEDISITQVQIEKFRTTLAKLKNVPIVHCANTSALLRIPESHFNMVRPGLILYGSLPSPSLNKVLSQKENHFQPVMQWKSQIILIKPIAKGQPISYSGSFITRQNSLVATLPIGYADGLHRSLSNKIDVLIRGKRAPQIGNICMDMTLIDVTKIQGVEEGDEVVLFGEQEGQVIQVEEMAIKGETIPYEILCNVGKRVPRIYNN
jgi:alanine racemase